MFILIRILILILLFIPFLGCRGLQKKNRDGQLKALSISELDWELLNPARKDKSPKATTLWGDRKGNEPTGF